jgi:hypothetical protein
MTERYQWTYAYAARGERLEDFLRLGWTPHDSLANTAHEQYAVLVEWLCDCHCPFPPKVERNTR